jgi:hypothetical protein
MVNRRVQLVHGGHALVLSMHPQKFATIGTTTAMAVQTKVLQNMHVQIIQLAPHIHPARRVPPHRPKPAMEKITTVMVALMRGLGLQRAV